MTSSQEKFKIINSLISKIPAISSYRLLKKTDADGRFFNTVHTTFQTQKNIYLYYFLDI